jgi:glycerol kinase
MGAAYLAGLAVGYWKDLDDIKKNWAVDRYFDPVISEQETEQRVKGWKKAVACAKYWAEE